MVKCCFVPGCNTGYALDVKQQKSIGFKNKSIFKAPKNTELLARWHRAIPRKDKMLTEKCYMCELHFKENDILLFDETILNDGMIFH
ncbi:THAP-type domain-containing protein [Aphis craccivora]|uniref:THAP-type domain-containing protein n=1 Tax=Aphis craccivora TaxID=307492 RepID=A0A6G0VN54_APHCR|nr:THAP-type domain-containing protein [Aphis craccivora]